MTQIHWDLPLLGDLFDQFWQMCGPVAIHPRNHDPEKFPLCLCSWSSSSMTFPNCWSALSDWNFVSSRILYKWNHIAGTFYFHRVCIFMWLPSVTIVLLRFSHVINAESINAYVYSIILFHYMDNTIICLAIHHLKDIWILFNFLANTNKAAMNIKVKVFVWTGFHFIYVNI